MLNRWATEADDARANSAVLAFIRPVSAPIGSTPSIAWESMMSPVGETTKTTIDMFPGCAFCHSTQASTMALAVSALITAFINVRLATAFDTVTLLNGAGVAPWAQACVSANAKCRNQHHPRSLPHETTLHVSSFRFLPGLLATCFFAGVLAASRKGALNSPKIFRFGFPDKRDFTPRRLRLAKFYRCFPNLDMRDRFVTRPATVSVSYFPISKSSNVLSTGFGLGFGFLAVGGTGSFFSVPMEKMWCVLESSATVRAP